MDFASRRRVPRRRMARRLVLALGLCGSAMVSPASLWSADQSTKTSPAEQSVKRAVVQTQSNDAVRNAAPAPGSFQSKVELVVGKQLSGSRTGSTNRSSASKSKTGARGFFSGLFGRRNQSSSEDGTKAVPTPPGELQGGSEDINWDGVPYHSVPGRRTVSRNSGGAGAPLQSRTAPPPRISKKNTPRPLPRATAKPLSSAPSSSLTQRSSIPKPPADPPPVSSRNTRRSDNRSTVKVDSSRTSRRTTSPVVSKGTLSRGTSTRNDYNGVADLVPKVSRRRAPSATNSSQPLKSDGSSRSQSKNVAKSKPATTNDKQPTERKVASSRPSSRSTRPKTTTANTTTANTTPPKTNPTSRSKVATSKPQTSVAASKPTAKSTTPQTAPTTGEAVTAQSNVAGNNPSAGSDPSNWAASRRYGNFGAVGPSTGGTNSAVIQPPSTAPSGKFVEDPFTARSTASPNVAYQAQQNSISQNPVSSQNQVSQQPVQQPTTQPQLAQQRVAQPPVRQPQMRLPATQVPTGQVAQVPNIQVPATQVPATQVPVAQPSVTQPMVARNQVAPNQLAPQYANQPSYRSASAAIDGALSVPPPANLLTQPPRSQAINSLQPLQAPTTLPPANPSPQPKLQTISPDYQRSLAAQTQPTAPAATPAKPPVNLARPGDLQSAPVNQVRDTLTPAVPAAPAIVAEKNLKPIDPVKPGHHVIATELPGIRVVTYGPEALMIKQTGKYEIRVENRGSIDAEGIVVRTIVPTWAEIEGETVSVGQVKRKQIDGKERFVWTIEELPAGETETLFVDLQAARSGNYELDVDWSLMPRKAVAKVKVRQPELNLTIQGPDEVVYGESATYKVRVLNPGDGTAPNVVFILSPDSTPQKQHIGDIPPGKEAQFDVELMAQDRNELTIKGLATGDLDQRAESEKKIRVLAADLHAVLTGPEVRYQNTVADYTLKIANEGTADCKKMMVELKLPSGCEYKGGIKDAQIKDRTLRWKVANLPINQEVNYDFKCLLAATGDGKFSAKATGSADGNTAVAISTRVESIADLVLTISDPTAPAPVGTEVTYEIVVRNRGSREARDVKALAQFSHGIEPRRIVGQTGQVVTGQVLFDPIATIAPGEEVRLQIVAVAEKGGFHRFRSEVTSEEIVLVAEEATKFMTSNNERISRRSDEAKRR